jgi:hypothetical protein
MIKHNPREFQYNSRIGFHYFPDTMHYRQQDSKIWLGELKSLHASWLILTAPVDRAIPEHFIRELIENNIEPVLHFNTDFHRPIKMNEFEPLLSAYASWGVDKVIFFDRPNIRSSWPSANWANRDLVEQFLEHYIPLANLALKHGLTPGFPPLEPGGDYWDTAFLRAVLENLVAGRKTQIINHSFLTCYAWMNQHPLDWGKGGPERWPLAHPYATPENCEDQMGFHIFDWYTSISKSVLDIEVPILLLGLGNDVSPFKSLQELDETDGTATSSSGGKASSNKEQIQRIMEIAHFLANLSMQKADGKDAKTENLPDNVLAGCYWLLAADPDSPNHQQSWFTPDGKPTKTVHAFRDWAVKERENEFKRLKQEGKAAETQGKRFPFQRMPTHQAKKAETKPLDEDSPDIKRSADSGMHPMDVRTDVPEVENSNPKFQTRTVKMPVDSTNKINSENRSRDRTKIRRPIEHYLLLPLYEWGVAEWHLDAIKPFVKKYHPTVGFSLKEAVLASKVTVVGNEQSFPEEILERLRASGCEVERISGDGTSIASQLATR